MSIIGIRFKNLQQTRVNKKQNQHALWLRISCVGVCMCGCFDNCVGGLVIPVCVLVFTVFCIVCTVYLY